MSNQRYRYQPVSIRQIKHTRVGDESDFEQHYTFGESLGKGSFGTVTEAIRVGDESRWAVKIINKEKAGSVAIKLLEREVAIMKKVDHPNIIHLEEVFETNTKMYLLMELCNLGGLEELLTEKGSFTEKEAIIIIRQLADAVAYMHGNDIVHRDLKLDNILLAKPTDDLFPYNIKLTDFGLSYTRGGSGSDYMMNQVVGTPIYMAPEVITNYGYSQQCDIWSIGVILHKLISGEAPFMALTEDELFELIKKGDVKFDSKAWANISDAAKQLIEGMMKLDPAHRLTSKEILCHPWIKGQQEMNGPMTTNVLEMMKEYSLEQKRLAEQQKVAEENNSEKKEEIQNEPTIAKSVSEVILEVKKANTKDGKRATSASNLQIESHPNSTKQVIPGPSSSRKSKGTKGVVPSYMLPTHNSNTKSKKKSTT